jgi:hypothetical protein
MQKPDIEVLIPMNPTRTYFTQLHYLLESCLLFGGECLKNARFIAYLGTADAPRDLSRECPWAQHYNLEWHWVDRSHFQEEDYFATAYLRFSHVFSSRMALLLDVDMICGGSLDGLILHSHSDDLFMGVTAPRSPFHFLKNQQGKYWWGRMFKVARLPEPPYVYPHLFWNPDADDPSQRFAPPGYVNFGMMLAPAYLMKRISLTYVREMRVVERLLDNKLKCQTAMPLAIKRVNVPWEEASWSYNFPCTGIRPWLGPFSETWLNGVRIWHYLSSQNDLFTKEVDFQSYAHVAAMLKRDMSRDVVLSSFQRKVAAVHSSLQDRYGQELFFRE